MRNMRMETRIARFWSKVDRSDPDGCWPWMGFRIPKGYGKHEAFTRQTLTHRWAYEITYGPIPEGIFVCHHCDNPPCCRPDHLFLGTVLDNYNDSAMKGRAVDPPHVIKTHCKRGHQFIDDTTYINPKTGARQCRQCVRERERTQYAAGTHRQQRSGRKPRRLMA